jgi:hypothetical protein
MRKLLNNFLGPLKFIDGITLATLLLAYIAFNTDRTLRQTLVAANRAWLSAIGLDVSGDIAGKDDLAIKVEYANLGKGPALHMAQSFRAAPVADEFSAKDEGILAGRNDACDGLHPSTEGPVIFPSAKQNWIPTIIPRSHITPDVIANTAALFLKGCFAYQTMNEEHFTWFCFAAYRNGQLSTFANSPMCADGQGAN